MSHPFSYEETGKTLSALWLFAILNTLFRDIHQLVVDTTIQEILTGHMNGNAVTEMVLFYGAFAVELLLLAMLLSRLLKPAHARAMNLILVPIAGLGTLMAPPSDLDDYVFASVFIATLAVIFVLAWNWKDAAETPDASLASIGGQR